MRPDGPAAAHGSGSTGSTQPESTTPTATRPARQLRHQLWRLAQSATTPYLPTDYLDLFAPLRPGADLRGRVEQIHPETPDAATLTIRPGSDWQGHIPGQYLRIGVDVEGVRHWRAYSLTHGPRPDGRISITVKAVEDGVVSHALGAPLTPRDVGSPGTGRR